MKAYYSPEDNTVFGEDRLYMHLSWRKTTLEEALQSGSLIEVNVSPISDGTYVAKCFSGLANRMANAEDIRKFVGHLTREHRTLQQSAFRIAMNLINAFSKQSYDARNQKTVEMCRKIVEATKDDYIPFI